MLNLLNRSKDQVNHGFSSNSLPGIIKISYRLIKSLGEYFFEIINLKNMNNNIVLFSMKNENTNDTVQIQGVQVLVKELKNKIKEKLSTAINYIFTIFYFYS
jgi:hypothetical protein